MKKNILILNGPNLNLLGKRQPGIYGHKDFDNFLIDLKNKFQDFNITYYQSNIEGEIINKLHEVGFDIDGIVLNAAAYTHTSVGIGDAVASIDSPVIESTYIKYSCKRGFQTQVLYFSKCQRSCFRFWIKKL
jgi:3-dehydroquinate dehydratase-2